MAVPLSATMPSPPPSVDFSGKWYNQRGSEMDLVVDGSIIKGPFRKDKEEVDREDSKIDERIDHPWP